MTIPFAKLKTRLLLKPKVKAEYDALVPEFKISAELIKARLRAGLSQAELAARMGTSQSTIARLEAARRCRAPRRICATPRRPAGPRPNRKTANWSAASSARGKPRPTKGRPMKKETSKRLNREQLAQLKSLAALPDNAIDTSDAPELLDWSGAKRGVFYRPVMVRLDRPNRLPILRFEVASGSGF
jgi:hypothetical protein